MEILIRKLRTIIKYEGKNCHISTNIFGFIFFITLFVILLLTTVISIWVNIKLYQENNRLSESIFEINHELYQNEDKLERLINLEAFLKTYAPNLVGLSLTESKVKMQENVITLPNSPILPAAKIATEATEPIDHSLASLQNVHIKLNPTSITIEYTLENLNKSNTLSGEQVYTLINFENGKYVHIPLNSEQNNNFAIKNHKHIEVNLPLQGYEINSRARLQVDIVQKGIIIFRDFYPIDR